jgi:hypothetical protein
MTILLVRQNDAGKMPALQTGIRSAGPSLTPGMPRKTHPEQAYIYFTASVKPVENRGKKR